MAAGTKIIFRFGTPSGEKTFSYNYGNDDASSADIKAAMNAFIANGEIFKYRPMTAISAKYVITTEGEFDIS